MGTVALVDDLMDRSRLSAAVPGIAFARDPAGCAGAAVIVVDLAHHADAIAVLREAVPDARIVAFGPHVDGAALTRARDDGADAVMARSAFFRDLAAAVAPA